MAVPMTETINDPTHPRRLEKKANIMVYSSATEAAATLGHTVKTAWGMVILGNG